MNPTQPQLLQSFQLQRQAFLAEPYPNLSQRLDRLQRLEALLKRSMPSLAQALDADFGCRSPRETYKAEIFPTLDLLRYCRAKLPGWMRGEKRPTSPWFWPSGNQVLRQPLGVVGVISPWNYPIYLSLAPLVQALAAGNRVMLKLPEDAPRTSALLAEGLHQAFATTEVTALQGDRILGAAFAALPWDHLLFTGSTAVGKQVMQAASPNLTPVTLELGGKSPALIYESYPLDEAAYKIWAAKLLNGGQTCVAPDYVLVAKGRVSEFVEASRRAVNRLYPFWWNNPDYTSIINQRHYDRLLALAQEAQDQGAKLVRPHQSKLPPDPNRRKIPPMIFLDAPPASRLRQEEIFGPLLPVVAYSHLEQALDFLASQPRPLALYYFDQDQARIRRVLTRSHAGGVTLNDCILHIAQRSLPFGGVGASGMGAIHGPEGFARFSHAKAVHQASRWSGTWLFNPPYGRWSDLLLKLLLK